MRQGVSSSRSRSPRGPQASTGPSVPGHAQVGHGVCARGPQAPSWLGSITLPLATGSPHEQGNCWDSWRSCSREGRGAAFPSPIMIRRPRRDRTGWPRSGFPGAPLRPFVSSRTLLLRGTGGRRSGFAWLASVRLPSSARRSAARSAHSGPAEIAPPSPSGNVLRLIPPDHRSPWPVRRFDRGPRDVMRQPLASGSWRAGVGETRAGHTLWALKRPPAARTGAGVGPAGPPGSLQQERAEGSIVTTRIGAREPGDHPREISDPRPREQAPRAAATLDGVPRSVRSRNDGLERRPWPRPTPARRPPAIAGHMLALTRRRRNLDQLEKLV